MCCSLGGKIAEYVPYQYTKEQLDSARYAIGDSNSCLGCRVTRATFHVFIAVGSFFLDTFFTPCHWIYILICIGKKSNNQRRSDSFEETGSLQQTSDSHSTSSQNILSLSEEERPPIQPLSQTPSNSTSASRSSNISSLEEVIFPVTGLIPQVSISRASPVLRSSPMPLSSSPSPSELSVTTPSSSMSANPSSISALNSASTSSLRVGISSSASSSSSIAAQSSASSSPPPPEDTGIGTPTWYRSTNERGEELFSLCRLPPLRFHKAPTFVSSNNKLNESTGLFSLFNEISPPLYTGDGDDVDYTAPAIGFECTALKSLLKSKDLSDGIPSYILNCSAAAPVNLPQNMRQDYVMHENATSYRFIYPIQLHPQKAGRVVECLSQDQTVPAFIKGLMLIGGYAYYNINGALLQVKSFSVSNEALEVLSTGKALNLQAIGFPDALLQNFQSGVAITSGTGNWAGQKNLQSSQASVITARALMHLTHFAYIPQSLYESHQQMIAAAPFGGFLYRTKSGEFQFVPIGTDYIPQVVALPGGAQIDLSEEQIQQNNKQRTLARLFYMPGSSAVSMQEIDRLLPPSAVSRTFNKTQVTLTVAGGVNYTVAALTGQKKITIQKNTAQGKEITANLDDQGRISNCADPALFAELVNEVYPHLMKSMIQVSGGAFGRISTIRESIAFAATEHLSGLTTVINAGEEFSVNYLDIDERRYIVIDAGGVRRDYVSELFSSLLRNSDLFEVINSPANPENGLFNLKSDISSNPQQQTILKNMGVFFAWILNNHGSFPAGRGLSSKFFNYLHFCLTNSTSSASREAFLNLYKFECSDANALRILNQAEAPQNLTDTERGFFLGFLIDDLALPALEEVSFGAYDEAYQIVKQKWSLIKQQAQTAMIDKVKALLVPYEVLAERLRFRLRIRLPFTPIALQQGIEGQLDREKIAMAIFYPDIGGRQAILNKVAWIREWIRNPTTPIKEIENFIKAVTGSRALGLGSRIRVNEMAVATKNYFPVYHTCFCSIDMPFGRALDDRNGEGHHRTPELFLESFKEGLRQALASNGFQMG